MKINNNPLRTLARSEYWQNMYRNSKEHNIKLFANESEMSRLQIVFLSYISLYDQVYTDIASNDSGIMDLDRIKDDMLIDAYITAKRKNKNKKKDNRDKQKMNNSGIPSVSFVTSKKRR